MTLDLEKEAREFDPRYGSLLLLLRSVAERARQEGENFWKREATVWDEEVAEFGHPIDPEYQHHEVRDWLNDAFLAGRREALAEATLTLENTAKKLKAWMESLPIGSKERVDKSLRAAEWFAAAEAVRALAEKDEK